MAMGILPESLRRSIGIGITRFRFRKYRDEIISFGRSVSDARRALLIMPMRRPEPLPVVTLIELLKRRFPEAGLTVVTWGPSLELMQMLPHSHFVRILETEITPFYLPRRETLQRIKNTPYDVAIDLNLDLVLPSGYICRESNARVRIGFAGRRSDLFYNFQIGSHPSSGRRDVYDRLAACLEMF
jgi:hypothetical protein